MFRVGAAYAVIAWILLQITDVLGPILNLPNWVARLVLLLLVLGFPLSLFFAWLYELTPDGLKRESEIDRDRPTRRSSTQKLDRAIIVVLLVALVWFAWDRYRMRNEPPPDSELVVAVLPFKASGSDDGGFLASGLHDDLLTRLAKLGAFRVISRTSMMEYADTTKNMRTIGAELGAGYILEGAVQARGDTVRINAQLIQASADEHIWAEVYQRDLTATDLFEVQAELAIAIAAALQTKLSPADLALVNEVPTQNIEAYNAYLRGLQLYQTANYVGTQRDRDAVAEFEEAVRLDPKFALAWAGLATARIRAACCQYEPEKGEAVLEALNRARALAPGMLESDVAWAEYLYRFRSEFAPALQTLEAQGNRVNGSDYALKLMAWLNRRLGRYEESYETLEIARALQPRNPSIYLHLAHIAWSVDDCEAAGEYIDTLNALAADEPESRVRTAEYELECHGDGKRAVELIRGVDFNTVGGVYSAEWAAWQARDVNYLLFLYDKDATDRDLDDPIWEQIQLASVYRYLEPDEAKARDALDSAEVLLDRYSADPSMAEGWMYAAMMAHFSCLRGDATATRQWIDEHRRRFRESDKGDISEERRNRFHYAFALACAGAYDEAVEELRVMLEEPGGHRFPYVDGAAPFDALEDHPGYKELRLRFGGR